MEGVRDLRIFFFFFFPFPLLRWAEEGLNKYIITWSYLEWSSSSLYAPSHKYHSIINHKS